MKVEILNNQDSAIVVMSIIHGSTATASISSLFPVSAFCRTTDAVLFQELFQGKDKDFNVQKALSARSLRDFDGVISMVSHGFCNLDDFYSENSTRLSIAYVKIPLLFIQV